MAAELVDLGKLKVTRRTQAWLEGKVRAYPHLSRQEIVRNELDRIAAAEFHAARVMIALEPNEGNGRERGGNGRDSGGRR